MDDGTAFKDSRAWIERQEQLAQLKKSFFKRLVLVLVFLSGMSFQYYLDSDIRKMASDCMEYELSQIQSMPNPTKAQITQAHNNVKRVTPEYLKERLGK